MHARGLAPAARSPWRLTAACGGGGSSATTPERTSTIAADGLPAAEGTLRVLAREGYTEDSWIIPFQQETGCRVQVRYLGPGDDTSALLAQGSYDVVSLASQDSPRSPSTRVIRPIDPALFPHFRTLRQACATTGARYAVARSWGCRSSGGRIS